MNLSRLSAVALLGSAMTTLAGPTNIPSITVNPYLPAAVSPGRVFLAVALPCIMPWALLGAAAARLLQSPTRLRVFNAAMAVLLVLSMLPVAFGE